MYFLTLPLRKLLWTFRNYSQHIVLSVLDLVLHFCVKELGFALPFFGGRKLPVMSTSISTTTIIAWPDSFEDSE